MKPYCERKWFSDQAVEIWRKATKIVEAIPTHWFYVYGGGYAPLESPYLERNENPPELRCHEVARVVGAMLGLYSCVVDGLYGGADHSWLDLSADTLLGETKIKAINARLGHVILDVYSCGRLPQVQLVDVHFMLPEARNYQPGELRTDINTALIDSIVARLHAESKGQVEHD